MGKLKELSGSEGREDSSWGLLSPRAAVIFSQLLFPYVLVIKDPLASCVCAACAARAEPAVDSVELRTPRRGEASLRLKF